MLTTAITRALRRRKVQVLSIAALAAISSVGFVRQNPTPVSVVAHASRTRPVTSVRYLATATKKAVKTPRVATARSSAMGLPNLEHPRVQSWIKRFTTDQRGSFATYLNRMPRYEKMISSKLAKRDMPQGLIYLAMIESGFNPTARSPVKASGLWQFMAPTGKQYGLKVTRRIDERNNPARATDAALAYLNDLHRQFGSWYLAAAAYNTGPGRVARVMKQVTGRTRGTDADYYRIAHRLPAETRDYVPKMIAAARIGNNPARYGFAN
jgi:membrane-bound lytic murein transglycosylase D